MSLPHEIVDEFPTEYSYKPSTIEKYDYSTTTITEQIYQPSELPTDEHDLQWLQDKAILTWSRRVKLCFLFHIIICGCLVHSYYWFTTVIAFIILIGAYIYAYSVKQKKKHVNNTKTKIGS